MVAFEGDIEFKHAGMGGGSGLRAALKRAVADEGISLMTSTVAARWPCSPRRTPFRSRCSAPP